MKRLLFLLMFLMLGCTGWRVYNTEPAMICENKFIVSSIQVCADDGWCSVVVDDLDGKPAGIGAVMLPVQGQRVYQHCFGYRDKNKIPEERKDWYDISHIRPRSNHILTQYNPWEKALEQH